jgi:hypothetical protein
MQLSELLGQIDSLKAETDWRRFKRAHLNAFDLAFTVDFRFEELQLVIGFSGSKSPFVTKRYPQQLSEDQIRSVATALTKVTLEMIRQRTTQNKPA